MDIMQTILVIFLSCALFILLVLAIVATVLVIGILRDFKKIADKAEEASETLGDVIRLIGKKALPMAISTIVAACVSKIKRSKK